MLCINMSYNIMLETGMRYPIARDRRRTRSHHRETSVSERV